MCAHLAHFRCRLSVWHRWPFPRVARVQLPLVLPSGARRLRGMRAVGARARAYFLSSEARPPARSSFLSKCCEGPFGLSTRTFCAAPRRRRCSTAVRGRARRRPGPASRCSTAHGTNKPRCVFDIFG
eukprot:gene2770-biopygen542